MKFRDIHIPIDVRIEDLLSRLEISEKTAQLRYNAPAIERLGIPPYNWWNEALHGVARNGRATIFPQTIGLAATWDRELSEAVATAISDEARAKHHAAVRKGSHQQYQGLTFWTPNINIFRDPRWGRGQETWGEDPLLTAEMAVRFVRGLQGTDPKHLKTAACAKHFAVHSGPEADRHTFDARPPEQDFWETYLPAFERLVREGVEAVMPAYNRTYGEPCAGSDLLLKEILRGRWDFRGHVVSDCWALVDFHASHRVTETPEESAAMALKAGTDLNCGSTYCHALDGALIMGLVTEQDVDRALRRLLRTRFRLGLFDPEENVSHAAIPMAVVQCDAHRDLALQAAVDSFVLLKNKDHALPLSGAVRSLLITGPNAASIEPMLGNYFGLAGRVSTVLEGVTDRMPEGVKADYRLGVGLTEAGKDGAHWAVGEAARSDVVIAAMGISPILEGEEGDAILSDNKGDRDRIELPPGQVDFLRRIRERIDSDQTGAKLIVLLFGGAALAIPEVHDMADAILQVWYPGERGGEAIASVLWGDQVPGGRLPITVPRSTDALPPYDDYRMAGRTYRFMADENILYPFGYGLGYSQVHFDALRVPSEHSAVEPLDVRLRLTNSGTQPVRETVQVYLDVGGAATRLAGFERVALPAGTSREVVVRLDACALQVIGSKGEKTPPVGEARLRVGAAAPTPQSERLGVPPPLEATVRFFASGV